LIIDIHPSAAAAPGAMASSLPGTPHLSVVVPVHNESENVASLLEEIHAALDGHLDFEAVFVDDASSDDTSLRLIELARRFPRLRVLRHRRNAGQSTAIATGVRAARGRLIATLDGDGQNDPADIPVLLNRWRTEGGDSEAHEPLLLAGWRSTRNDNWLRRLSSRIANGVRGRLLGDGTPDTGCGLKLLGRETFLALPYFDHMHRFLPALVVRHGGRVISVPVRHRPRTRGRSHYGVWNRLWVGLVDLGGVMWLRRRTRLTTADVLTAAGDGQRAGPATAH
jgi:dolichol-phosphate mannosyltransferase